MKKYIYKAIAIIMCIYCFDVIVGIVGKSMILSMPETSAFISKTTYAILKHKTDILILGASKAKHGYDPFMIMDSLGMDCYNAGEDGSDTKYYDMMMTGFMERCNPKIVVIDMATLALDHEPKVAGNRYIYGISSSADSFIEDGMDSFEKFKLNSALYRFNGFFGLYCSNLLSKNTPNRGFTPIEGEYSEGTIVNMREFVPNEKEVKYLNDIVCKTKASGTKLFICISPTYERAPGFSDFLSDYCKKNNVVFADFSTNDKFMSPHLFKDASHLNKEGASLFTKEIIKILE